MDKSIYAFTNMTEEERAEKRIAMKAMENWGPSLKYADKALRNDKEVVLAAVKQMGSALAYAEWKMRDDKEIVLAAIEEEGCLAHIPFSYASKRLRADPEVVMKAIKADGRSLKYADESFRQDKATVIEALKSRTEALEVVSEELKKDYDVILTAVKYGAHSSKYFDEMMTDIDRGLAGTPEENRKKCKEIAKNRKVKYFVHFTHLNNLDSILNYGLLTRDDLDHGKCGLRTNVGYQDRANCYVTDTERRDNMRDTISLSVTSPNRRMFYVKRGMFFQKDRDRNHWCIIRLKANTVLDHNCCFFADNAARHEYADDYEGGIPKKQRNTVFDFASLFRFYTGADGYPDTNQAEVMCTERIPVNEIDSVVFINENFASLYRDKLQKKGIGTVVDKSYFD